VTSTDTRTADFTTARPLLFAIAYRMLGSVSDAEDVVQDAYLRWLDAPDADVRAPRAYLATIVTRLSFRLTTTLAGRNLTSADAESEGWSGWAQKPGRV
jgi:RNA polymerase sigma-70 factor (ECF subfamily)